MPKNNNAKPYIANTLLLLLGCALIGAMWIHQAGLMLFFQDAILTKEFYYFLNPYVKIVYGICVILLTGKEMFIRKPINQKIKINAIAVIVLVLFLSAQMLIWQHAIGRYAAS